MVRRGCAECGKDISERHFNTKYCCWFPCHTESIRRADAARAATPRAKALAVAWRARNRDRIRNYQREAYCKKHGAPVAKVDGFVFTSAEIVKAVKSLGLV